MPQRRLTAPLVVPALLAALAAGTPLRAQHSVAGIDVNAASESASERAPQLFGSAGVAPRHRLGLSIQGTASRVESDDRDIDGTMTGSRTSGYRTTGSAFFGVASRLTVGAYLSDVQRVRFERDSAPVGVEPVPGAVPTRQGIRTPIGSVEMGAHLRLGLWQSTATRLGATYAYSDAVDTRPMSTVGVAAQHRVGRVTMHVAPALRFAKGTNAGGEVATEVHGRVGVATAVAVHPRVGLSLELLRDGFDVGTTDAAVGTRWRIGRLAIDAGVRGLVDHNTSARNASRIAGTVATHLVF